MPFFFGSARPLNRFSALFLLTTFSFFSEKVNAEYNSIREMKYNGLYGRRYINDETSVYYVLPEKTLPNKNGNALHIKETKSYTVKDADDQIYKIHFRKSIFDLDKNFEKMATECDLTVIPNMKSADISPIIFWVKPSLGTMAIEPVLEQNGYDYELDYDWSNSNLIDCLNKHWNTHKRDSNANLGIEDSPQGVHPILVTLFFLAACFYYREYLGTKKPMTEQRNGIEGSFQALQQSLQNVLNVGQRHLPQAYCEELERYQENLEKYCDILECAISAEIMYHPISLNTGETYNQASLLNYAKEEGFRGLCPYTRLPIEGNIAEIKENRVIKTIIIKILAHFTDEIYALTAQVPQFDKDYYEYQLSRTQKFKNDLLQIMTCPRTGVVFTNPIATNEGNTYEKAAFGSATTRRSVTVIQELIRHTKSLSEKDEACLIKKCLETSVEKKSYDANINTPVVNIGNMEMFFQRNKTAYIENEVPVDCPIEINQSGMYYTN